MSQWRTVDHTSYKVQTNGGTVLEGKEVMEMGNYNALMVECPTYRGCEFPGWFLFIVVILFQFHPLSESSQIGWISLSNPSLVNLSEKSF